MKINYDVFHFNIKIALLCLVIYIFCNQRSINDTFQFNLHVQVSCTFCFQFEKKKKTATTGKSLSLKFS